MFPQVFKELLYIKEDNVFVSIPAHTSGSEWELVWNDKAAGVKLWTA